MQKLIIGALVILLLLVGGIYFKDQPVQNTGSVNIANDYNSVTGSSTLPAFNVLKATSGTFGSVIITKVGAAGGTFNFYDATTTDSTKRTNTATTTLASFASNDAVGTYTFDSRFYYGLIWESVSSQGSTTVSYR